LQAGGIRRQLLAAAAQMVKEKDCPCIFMTVIAQHVELVNWYIRHGYRPTGETRPLLQTGNSAYQLSPLEFIVLKEQTG
jgi:ribosomal protein S18 acetylase RimI-like enzyme